MELVCVACRLIQPRSEGCIDCGDKQLVAPSQLTVDVVTGVTALAKPAATGWRDSVAVMLTAFAICGGLIGGFLLAGPWGGLFGVTATTIGGYNKQFWRAAFTRRPRVAAIALLPPPVAETFEGVVKAHSQRLADNAVAIATTYLFDADVIARRVSAVPFWLIAGERRILVDGTVRVSRTLPAFGSHARALKELAKLGLPIRRVDRPRIQMIETVLRPDAHITASGTLASIQVADDGGYRDNLVDALHGDPGQPTVVVSRD
jgi:hypothetical protein